MISITTINHIKPFIQLIIFTIISAAHATSILLVQLTHHMLEQDIFEYTESTNFADDLINRNHIIAYTTDIFQDLACSSSQLDVTILKNAYIIIAINMKLAEVSNNFING
jgi:hypothetical protein